MALDADFKGYVEENGVDFVVVIFGEFDPVLPLLRREVGGVDVIHGALGDEARLEHGAQVGEDKILKALLPDVVEEQRTNHVARERSHAVTLEPGTLAGTGQADGENYDAFGRTLRHGGGCGRPGDVRHRGRSGRRGLGGVIRFGENGGCDSFGSEGLRDGLFAATASASAASTTTAAATGSSCRFARRGRVDGVRDLVWNVWNIGGSGIGGIRWRGVSGRSFNVRSGSRTNGTTTGAGPGFRLRLRLVRGRFAAPFVFCVGCGRLLLGVKICRLERWRSRLVSGLGGLFFSPLKKREHPFTLFRLVTHMPRRGQWFEAVSRDRKHPSTSLRASSGHGGIQGRTGMLPATASV